MTKHNLRHYYEKAREEGWALVQFNWSSGEMLKGIVQAAAKLQSPLLVGTSEGDSGSVGIRQAAALVDAYRKETGLPIFLNLDHGKSLEYLKEAIDAGYDAVHLDGSALALEENIALTKKVVALAREHNISVVEGEVGQLQGGSTVHEEKTIVLDPEGFTKSEEAARFVKETGVDSLAITFGNVHGVYEKMPSLEFDRLESIQKSTDAILVLHGGSGIPDDQVLRAIKLGIVKMNLSTELRAAFTDTLREVLDANPNEVTPYKYYPATVDAVQKVTEEKIQFLGAANKV